MTHPVPPQRRQLLWAAIDLDGTLAEPLWTPENPTSHIGEPIWGNVEKAMELHYSGYKVAIHTSRPDTDYEAIETWLDHYRIPFKAIRTGKMLAAVYIDDRAVRADDPSWLARLREING